MVPVGKRHVELKAIIGRLLIKDATLRPNAKEVVAGIQRICALLGVEARDDTPPLDNPVDPDPLQNDQCSNVHGVHNDTAPREDSSPLPPPADTADDGDAEFYPSDFETYMDSDDSDACFEGYDIDPISQRRSNKHLGSSSEVKIYVSVSRNDDAVYNNTKGDTKRAHCAQTRASHDSVMKKPATTLPSSTMPPNHVHSKAGPTTTKSHPNAISASRGRTKSGSDRKSFKSVSEISSPPRSASTWDYLLKRAEQARHQLQRSTSTADASQLQKTHHMHHRRAQSTFTAAGKQIDSQNESGASEPGHQRAIKTILASASRLLHKSKSERICRSSGENVGDKACLTDFRRGKAMRPTRQANLAKRVGSSASTVVLFAHAAEVATEGAAKRSIKQQSIDEKALGDTANTSERLAQKSPSRKRISREPGISEMPPTSTPGAMKSRQSVVSRAKTPSGFSQIGQRRDSLLHQPPTPPPNATYRGVRRGSFANDDERDVETHRKQKIHHHQHAVVPPPPHRGEPLGALDRRTSSLAVTRRRTYEDLPVNPEIDFPPTRRLSLDDRLTPRSSATHFEVEEQAIRPRGSSTFSSVDAAQVRLKLGEKAFCAVSEVFRSAHERGICQRAQRSAFTPHHMQVPSSIAATSSTLLARMSATLTVLRYVRSRCALHIASGDLQVERLVFEEQCARC